MHRAAEMTDKVWTGKLKVVQRGKEAVIFLLKKEDGKPFAMCPVVDGAVERCPDSSRYFALKIQNAQGRHAFIGLAFNERNDAFDFNVALQEFAKDKERDKRIEQNNGVDPAAAAAAAAPAKDYSLKDGQKITVNVAAGSGAALTRKKERSRTTGSGGGFLAPPPGDTPSRKVGLLAPSPWDSGRRPKAVGGGGGASLLDDDPLGSPAAAVSPANAWPGDDGFGSNDGGGAPVLSPSPPPPPPPPGAEFVGWGSPLAPAPAAPQPAAS
ncbi:unnamed protein product, partial [Phaeothamnion confervicola]